MSYFLSNDIMAYPFHNKWLDMMRTIELFTNTLNHILKKNGLYTRMLILTKKSSINKDNSNINITRPFFFIVTRLFQIISNWNNNIKILKESNQWNNIEPLVVDKHTIQHDDSFSDHELSYLNNTIKGIFNYKEECTLIIDQYVNCIIINLYLTYRDGFINKLSKTKYTFFSGSETTIRDYLVDKIRQTYHLKTKYGKNPSDIQLLEYCKCKIIDIWNECLSNTTNGNVMCDLLDLDIPDTINDKTTYYASNTDLKNILIQPKIDLLHEFIDAIHTDKREYATKFIMKLSNVPERLKIRFIHEFLVYFLELFIYPVNTLFKQYNMTVNNIVYNNDNTENTHIECNNNARKLVESISTYIQNKPIENSQSFTDNIYTHLKNMELSPIFYNILKEHINLILTDNQTDNQTASIHTGGGYKTSNSSCSMCKDIISMSSYTNSDYLFN